ncbi:MAG: hypothetical protein ACTHXA_06050 [Gulosibacter sp.]|uniref:hypothetical protein n=1 Tax=Gulosibacter sp. TaxID=2817531 RepID=UPI003F90D731
MTELDDGVNRQRHPDLPDLAHSDPPHFGSGPTTHSAYGAGEPRLVMIGFERGEDAPVFHLTREVTKIGSAPDNDVVLEGLLPHHATITHTDSDEYVLDSMGETETSSAGEESPYDDAPKGARLRHGGGFKIAGYSFAFQRREYADHGRPFGGRTGGEFSRQSRQESPPDYREAHTGAIDQERIADAQRAKEEAERRGESDTTSS